MVVAGLLASASVRAANDANLDVSVQLVAPTCSLNFSQSTVDMGSLEWEKMDRTNFNVLAPVDLGLEVNCAAARSFSLRMSSIDEGMPAAGAAAAAMTGARDEEAFPFPAGEKGPVGAYVFEVLGGQWNGAPVSFFRNSVVGDETQSTPTKTLPPRSFVTVKGDDGELVQGGSLKASLRLHAVLAPRDELNSRYVGMIRTRSRLDVILF